MNASREWATFLAIPSPATTDKAPSLDPGWCAAHGVNTGAEVVLRLLRDEVLPLIDELEEHHHLGAYHFLIHDRLSGVPTTENDHGSYIHLRLAFCEALDLNQILIDCEDEFQNFKMTRPITTEERIGSVAAGLDPALFLDDDGYVAANLINKQSDWVLELIRMHHWKDDGAMVRQVLQFGHYFANMLQMSFRL